MSSLCWPHSGPFGSPDSESEGSQRARLSFAGLEACVSTGSLRLYRPDLDGRSARSVLERSQRHKAAPLLTKERTGDRAKQALRFSFGAPNGTSS